MALWTSAFSLHISKGLEDVPRLAHLYLEQRIPPCLSSRVFGWIDGRRILELTTVFMLDGMDALVQLPLYFSCCKWVNGRGQLMTSFSRKTNSTGSNYCPLGIFSDRTPTFSERVPQK